jgi:hypothetical protein
LRPRKLIAILALAVADEVRASPGEIRKVKMVTKNPVEGPATGAHVTIKEAKTVKITMKAVNRTNGASAVKKAGARRSQSTSKRKSGRLNARTRRLPS